MFKDEIATIKALYPNKELIPLHEPYFSGNEKKYVLDCIDSTFVSSVGKYVNQLEDMVCEFTKAKSAIAVNSGTSALHLALITLGVEREDEVITQSLTFVATCNAISYCGAKPIFIDISPDNLGMCCKQLEFFLRNYTKMQNGVCVNQKTGKKIKAIVPMHTFGIPCEMDSIKDIAKEFNLALVEDAAESIGSRYKDLHTGLWGDIGVLSFNGNKTITTGGGGMLITNDDKLAEKLKHISTTAKVNHPHMFIHDEIGYNYRMPNINAALGCAQFENLTTILKIKTQIHRYYQKNLSNDYFKLLIPKGDLVANHWLNALVFKDEQSKEGFIADALEEKVFVRSVWKPMHELEMYKDCFSMPLHITEQFSKRILNIPSGLLGSKFI